MDKFVDNQNNTTFTHSSLIGRGYTSHEHFFEVGLIHMNGRMYDASLSRFLSPDNYIQDPFNTQNYNRYSYVLNNPLKYVDINGENYGGTGVENGGNGWLYSLAVIVSSIFASWGEEIKNSQIGRWLNTNIGKPVERWVNKHIVNPIKKLFGSGKKNPISYDVPSMEFAGAIPSGNNLQIATSMPTSMSIGRGMNGTSDGYGDSFFERLKSLPTAIWNGDVFKEAEGVEALYPGGEIGTWFYPGGAALKAGSLFKLSKIPNAIKGSRNLWKVGSYKSLRGLEAGLDAHHVGQRALMKKFISKYNPRTAPSILVPKKGHTIGTGVLGRGTSGFNNARQVLARDIFELRRVYGGQGIPNTSLQKLIQMNKQMYPGAFVK